MGFVVPAFLAAVAFAGIPLLVHLMFRRRAPRLFFAATRFVRAASRRTARRRRLDNLLLFVLRTLLLALLALGLSGPFIRRAAAGGRAGTDVVIVLDNSLSMSATSQGIVAFTRAKEAIGAILATLESGDLVTLVATAAPDAADAVNLSADAAAARERVARITVSDARGSLSTALAHAASVFEESAASEKLLYVVTDLQASGFPEPDALPGRVRSALASVPAVVYDCGLETARNLSLGPLSVASQGGVVGTALEVTARIVSNSPVEENVGVSLSAGERRVAGRTVAVPPSGAADVSLSMIVESPGVLDATVDIDATDAIRADNRRFFCVMARDRIRVLILKKEDRSPDYDDDAFFLRRALDPFAGDPSGARGPFEVAERTYSHAGGLASYDIVCLLMRGGVGDALSNSLADYLKSGGSLLVFPCDDPEAAGLEPWSPARLVGLRSARRAAGESFTFGSLDVAHPALAAFDGEPPSLYNKIRVYDYWLVDVVDKSSTVVARLDTGDPGVILSSAVPGRVVLFTVAPVRAMTNLPASRFFLPLAYEISYYLAVTSRGLAETFAGDPISLAPAGVHPEGLVVTSPDGRRRLVNVPRGEPLYWTETLPGQYRVRAPQSVADTSAFCVNTHPAESDLRRLDAGEVPRRLPGRPVLVVSSIESLQEAVVSLQPVLALGDVILYTVLAVALFECLASSRFSTRSGKRT